MTFFDFKVYISNGYRKNTIGITYKIIVNCFCAHVCNGNIFYKSF